MDGIEGFLQDHRPKLLRYLDGKAPQLLGDPGPMEYVEQVLNEWSQKFSDRMLRRPCLKERTFWIALYQLECLVEHPVRGQLDPYERVLLEDLAHVREVLRGWRELPERFYATRPGE
jgi:hypothetical protein